MRFSKFFTEEEIKASVPITLLASPKKNMEMYELNDFYMVKVMVASIAVRMVMKKYWGRYEISKVYSKYYNVLSKYSHKKLVILLNVKPFQIIWKDFFISDDFQMMLRNDETLSRNREIFQMKAKNFLKIIEEK